MAAPAVQESLRLAVQHHQAGRLAEAESLYRQILASNPNNSDALHMLGVLANQLGRTTDALDLIQRAIRLDPRRAIYHNNLGLVLARQRRWPDAEHAFRDALAINPAMPQALNNLTNVLREMGRLDEALAVASKAIASNCASPEALGTLGMALVPHGRMDEAIGVLSKSAELRADADVLLNLGNALKLQGRLDESNAAYAKAIELRADFAVAHLNLATNYCSQALVDKALDAFRQAVRSGSDDPQFHAGLVHALYYHPDYDAQAILREHRAWADRFAEPLSVRAKPQVTDSSPERQIRIGYVSAEFRDHPVGRFLLPLLAHHDRRLFEIFGYSSSPISDQVTQMLQGGCDQWIDSVNLSDEQLARKVREDRIDILVDLALHTAGRRLLAFARKPAPVRVTWLAYPGTSGISAMDYRFSDPFLDPPGTDADYTEETVRLPHCFWCYQAPPEAPPVNALPALSNRYVTFGSFNNFFKASSQTLQLWARVLAATPDSRMLIHSRPGSHLDRARAAFQNMGVNPDRLEFFGFLPAQAYWQQHYRIDIALDTWPYAGGTTTCDALWMGVPVVTLAGRTAVGRSGASILANAGLAELVAQSPDQYVQIASQHAGDLPRLAKLRANMREELLRSPLMDAPRFASDFEQALRSLWRARCAAEL